MCFLINFLFWWSVHWCEWAVKVSLFLCYCQFLPLCLLVFVLCIVLLCWVHRYLKLLYLTLLIPWSLCSVLPYLLWFSLLYGLFCLTWGLLLQLSCASHLHWIYLSILPLPVYMCLEVWSGFLVDSIYMNLAFFIHSASLCLLVGAFNPFTFKAIVYTYIYIYVYVYICF